MSQPRTDAEAPKRAIGLIRVSMEKDGGTSPEVQRYAIESYATSRGYRIVDWVEGVEESKYSGSRRSSAWWPKLDGAIARLEAGECDVLVVWKFSRVGRQRLRWAVALDRVDVAGGSIESATEANDATPSGRFARGMLGEMNAYQAELIGETWREAHARRRRMGLPSDGGPRYGYDKQDDGTYTPNDTEAPVLAEMYRRYLRGEGFTRIVRWLNSGGITTKAGGEWSRVTVTHLLDAGFGAGKIIHRGQRRGGVRDWRISAATFHDGRHDPVITEAEWEAYKAMRLDAPAPPQVVEPKYMLTGLIFCGDCGAPMHVGNQGLKDYKCSRAGQKRTGRGMFMTRALVETVVREWVTDLARDVDELAAAAVREQERRVIQLDNATTLDRKIEDLTNRLGRITVRWAGGSMPDAAYEAAVVQLDSDLAALKERRQRVAPRPSIDPRQLAMNLDADWDELTVLEQRNLLRALISRVEIHRPTRQGTGVWRERVHIIPAWNPAVG
ncbi:MAG: hypothetical protein K0S49_56 [Microbacterium sp.]|nr:hypothetical protein [Microbacterium sp.]